jgi:hypothetical protein
LAIKNFVFKKACNAALQQGHKDARLNFTSNLHANQRGVADYGLKKINLDGFGYYWHDQRRNNPPKTSPNVFLI